jgi:uncharacterized protein YqeY
MGLYQQILDDLKKAMLAKDQDRVITLRAIKAALLEKEIAERKGAEVVLSEEQVIGVLQKMVRQRKESASQFAAAGRIDLQKKEEKEAAIIESYLPRMMSEEEIEAYVSAKMVELNVTKATEMGKLMGALMKELRGKADGQLINKVVRGKLQ